LCEQKKRLLPLLVIAIVGLSAQIPMILDKLNSVHEYGDSLVAQETEESDVVMARWSQVHAISYLTGRNTVAMKYGGNEEMLEYAKSRGVDWVLLDGFDSKFERSSSFAKYISGLPKVERGGFTLARI
jgi:hypothetical protein